MERGPKTVVMYIELEDNCGAVIAKRKVEIPVSFTRPEMLDDMTVTAVFDEFTKTGLPTKFQLP